MTGMDTATPAAAKPNRKASDARRRVVPPPRGPSTTARNRSAARVPATAGPTRGPALGAPCAAAVAMATVTSSPSAVTAYPVADSRDRGGAGHAKASARCGFLVSHDAVPAQGLGWAGHAIVPDGDGDGEAAAWTVNGETAAPARRLASGSRLGC